MKITGKKEYLFNLESTAITDIILNMFIFFFISFSLIYTFKPEKVEKIDVKLPSASSTTAIDGDPAVVFISADGVFYFGGAPVDAEALGEILAAVKAGSHGGRALLKVDTDAPFRRVVKALDVINGAGVRDVSLAAVAETPRAKINAEGGLPEPEQDYF